MLPRERRTVSCIFFADKSHIFRKKILNNFGVLYSGKGLHKPMFAYEIVRIHSLMIYTDLSEYKTTGITRFPCCAAYLLIRRSNLATLSVLDNALTIISLVVHRIRRLLKSFSNSIHIDSRGMSGEKTPFASAGNN